MGNVAPPNWILTKQAQVPKCTTQHRRGGVEFKLRVFIVPMLGWLMAQNGSVVHGAWCVPMWLLRLCTAIVASPSLYIACFNNNTATGMTAAVVLHFF